MNHKYRTWIFYAVLVLSLVGGSFLLGSLREGPRAVYAQDALAPGAPAARTPPDVFPLPLASVSESGSPRPTLPKCNGADDSTNAKACSSCPHAEIGYPTGRVKPTRICAPRYLYQSSSSSKSASIDSDPLWSSTCPPFIISEIPQT